MLILIFLSNELQNPDLQKELGIPLEFITFGFIEGKLYKHYRNEGTFILKEGKPWGNDVVYGSIFLLKDDDFYIRILDSYHQCSSALLGKNHSKDVHHRKKDQATPIYFDTLDELSRLKYREGESVEVTAYLGNINHPKIKQRLNSTIKYRLVNGIDKNFIKLFREVTK